MFTLEHEKCSTVSAEANESCFISLRVYYYVPSLLTRKRQEELNHTQILANANT